MIRRGKLSVANAHPHQANSQSGRARHSVFRNQMGFTKTHTHTHIRKVQRNVLFDHMTPDRIRMVTKHQIPLLIVSP